MKDEPKIIDTGIEWDEDKLTERDETDMIVLHHTGDTDMDASAKQIHGWHLNQGWAGIGYHYVVRKKGTIEEGRPEWAVGSHAYGENGHSIGIHVCGGFNSAEPTDAQIEAVSHLVAYLCEKYDIPIDREHIVGHREVNDDTSCPGDSLFAKLDLIVSKAAWYANKAASDPDTDEKEAEWEKDMEKIKKEMAGQKRYNTLADIPEWAKLTIEKMIAKGILKGGGKKDENGKPADIDFSKDMLRMVVYNDRAGLYD